MQVSIVPFSDLEDRYKRIDAEYYQPIYLALDKELQQFKTKTISSIAKVTDGEHGNVELLNDGIKYLTAENIKKGFVDTKNIRYVSKEVDERNKRASVYSGDILVSIKGTLGEIAVAECSLLPANMNRDVAIIKPSIDELISEYIAVFLMSRIGNLQAIREGSGGVQQMITLGRLGDIKIPILIREFQRVIKKIFDKFNTVRNKSLIKYTEAQTLLLSELCLTHWQPKHQLTFIKNYSDTKQAGRIDAEYYQPKYDDIINAIENYSGGWDTLDNFMDDYSTGYPFSSKSYVDEGTYLIRINNIINGQLDLSGSVKIPTKDKKLSKKDIVLEGDILISMSGTIGSACKIPQNIDAVINQRIFKFTPHTYDIDVLTLIINSNIGLQQLLKIGTGGVQTNISGNDLKNILIPLLPKEKQAQIQQKVTESFNLRKQSKHLLECAKKAVEMAIEQDEQTAIRWL